MVPELEVCIVFEETIINRPDGPQPSDRSEVVDQDSGSYHSLKLLELFYNGN